MLAGLALVTVAYHDARGCTPWREDGAAYHYLLHCLVVQICRRVESVSSRSLEPPSFASVPLEAVVHIYLALGVGEVEAVLHAPPVGEAILVGDHARVEVGGQTDLPDSRKGQDLPAKMETFA